MPITPTVEDDPQAAAKLAGHWIDEITHSEQNQLAYLEKCKKIRRRYMREDKTKTSARSYAMLWSNTQTILPATYSHAPTPVATRRFKDGDPVAREATEVLERALIYHADQGDMDGSLKSANLDFTLIGRAQVWVRYIPTYGPQVTPRVPALQISQDPCTYQDEDGNEFGEGDKDFGERDLQGDEQAGYTVAGEPYQPITFERAGVDFVAVEDFGHSVARTWDEVTYVWRAAYLTKEGLAKRFGEEMAKKIPLDWSPKRTGSRAELSSLTKKARIIEIWDKESRKVFWISKSYAAGVLDERDDPLGLEGFFPCPKPLLGTLANENLFPVPDYLNYQDQAEEVDVLTARIGELQKGLKVLGMYAGDAKTSIANLMASPNGTMVPVPAWQGFKEVGGARGNVEWWPIDQVVAALTACISLRKQLIEDIYQITGVADILRGASDPRETAAAQDIKAHWGAVRIRDHQKEVARFARDILRLQGEVIAEHFSQETLAAMTQVKLLTQAEKAQVQQQQAIFEQQQALMMGHNGGPPMGPEMAQGATQAPQGPALPPQGVTGPPAPPQGPQPPQIPPEVAELMDKPTWEEVMALLRDDAQRSFRIDIETDSTIEGDDMQAKEDTTELMTALAAFITAWGPAVQAAPQLAPVVAELLKFSLRRFRAGRSLEDVVERALDEMVKNPPTQPPAAAPGPTGPTPEELQIAAAKVQVADKQADTDAMAAQAKAANDAAKVDIQRGDLEIKAFVAQQDPEPQVNA